MNAEPPLDLLAMSAAETAAEIERHDRLYWEAGEPEISDAEYERLTRRLAEIAPGHPLLRRVNAPAVASVGKVRHQRPMLSLSKAYTLDEVVEWAAKLVRSPDERLVVQPKYDGISAIYRGGVLATRGDGHLGEDVSDKIPLVELEAPGHRGPLDRPARGEIVIRSDDFAEIYSRVRRKDGAAYKNPRNAVGGIMGLKDIDDLRRQGAKLTLVDYGLLSFEITFRELRGQWDGILAEIAGLPYPMDGLVVKLADEAYSDSLGNTAHHPRGQIAFKFDNETGVTKLLDVEWSFGKNCLTPVAKLEPIELGGVTIRHASLHNAQNIIDKDIQVGDEVVVKRAGEVIPYVIKSIPGEGRRPCLIERCPCCHSELERGGPELRCVNPECLETNLRRLLAAVRNIGIERLGEPNLRRMMLNLGVKKLSDVFALRLADILKLEGYQEKSARNLLNEIATARHAHDYELLSALNIPSVGINMAKELLRQFTLGELRRMAAAELAAIRGVGPERAEAISRELRVQSEFLDELLACLEVTESKGASRGATVCFTGKMPEKRSYYQELAAARGLASVDSVTAELDTLVAANPDEGGSKLAKARKLGVRVVALEQWLTETPAGQHSSQAAESAPASGCAPDSVPVPANSANSTATAPVPAESAAQTSAATGELFQPPLL